MNFPLKYPKQKFPMKNLKIKNIQKNNENATSKWIYENILNYLFYTNCPDPVLSGLSLLLKS